MTPLTASSAEMALLRKDLALSLPGLSDPTVKRSGVVLVGGLQPPPLLLFPLQARLSVPKAPLTVAGRSQHLSLVVQPKLQTISNIWSWNCTREGGKNTEHKRMLQMASIDSSQWGMQKHGHMH